MVIENKKYLDGKQLAFNVWLNIFGVSLPAVAAFFAIPILVEQLGVSRFGVLAIGWMVVGYFSLLDLGFGRALTKLVAEKLGKNELDNIVSLVWTAIFTMFLLGVVAAFMLVALTPAMVLSVLKVPEFLHNETLKSFYILAAIVPIVSSTAGLRGVLESYQHFGLINVVRIPLGISNFIGPLLVLPFSDNLVPIVSFLAVSRLIAWFAYIFFCLKVVPLLKNRIQVSSSSFRELISFGSWITVSNVVGPVMVYLDRFLIGAFISMASVAYYATPHELVTKVLIIPTALMGVFFPAFSTTLVYDRAKTARLFERAAGFIFVILFPLLIAAIMFSSEGLTFWLDSEFALQSAAVLQWLAIGVFVNSIAQVPYSLIQSTGRPDLTAKTHLFELPIYFFAMWLVLPRLGVEGAAIVWALRAALDAFIFLSISAKLMPDARNKIFDIMLKLSLSLVLMYFSMSIELLFYKILVLLAVGLILLALITIGFFPGVSCKKAGFFSVDD